MKKDRKAINELLDEWGICLETKEGLEKLIEAARAEPTTTGIIEIRDASGQKAKLIPSEPTSPYASFEFRLKRVEAIMEKIDVEVAKQGKDAGQDCQNRTNNAFSVVSEDIGKIEDRLAKLEKQKEECDPRPPLILQKLNELCDEFCSDGIGDGYRKPLTQKEHDDLYPSKL